MSKNAERLAFEKGAEWMREQAAVAAPLREALELARAVRDKWKSADRLLIGANVGCSGYHPPPSKCVACRMWDLYRSELAAAQRAVEEAEKQLRACIASG